MCGICGIINHDPARPVQPEEIRAMRDALAHRGPDDTGEWFGPGAGLGHRWLAIIDPEGGHQPVSDDRAGLHLIFNGEIYNHRELREELEKDGVEFRTKSDSEVLLRLFERDRERMLGRLVGMFAIAVWDEKDRSLFLARDHIGQKPLYYRHGADRFAFASELKSLRRMSDFDENVSRSAISFYLSYQYVPHPLSIYENVFKLPPAHYAVFRDGALCVERWWNPFDAGAKSGSVRETLEKAVEACMVSDVPVGSFLSGGIDSTIVTALMAAKSEKKITAFNIGFDEPEYDESGYARQAADYIGVEFVGDVARPNVPEAFRRLVDDLDEPMADSSAIPMSLLSGLTSGHGKVALSGDGGDELFLGYPRYKAVALAARIDRMPRFLRRILFGGFWKFVPESLEQKTFRRRLKRFVSALAMEPMRRYYEWITIFSDEQKAALMGADATDTFGLLRDSAYAARCSDDVSKAAAFDIEYYLPCDLMAKVDRTSMAHSLEVRAPFLDHRLVELAVSLSVKDRLRGEGGKFVLRKECDDLLPRCTVNRPKMGFGVPVGRWLREDMAEMVRDILLDSTSCGRGLFDARCVENLVLMHLKGRADNGAALWALMCLEWWMRAAKK